MLKVRKKPILMKITGGSGEDGRVWQWTRLGLPLPNRTNQFLHVILNQEVIG
jgi:hypothetical protein